MNTSKMNFNTATSGAGGGVKKSPAPSSQQATSPSLMSPSAFQFSPEDIMEMEDWEVAPGIITEAGGSNADSRCSSSSIDAPFHKLPAIKI